MTENSNRNQITLCLNHAAARADAIIDETLRRATDAARAEARPVAWPGLGTRRETR